MPKKISLTEFRAMLADPDIPDEKLRPYLIASKVQSTAFRPEVLPNPETVEISEEELELESAMAFGNRFCRFRRQRRFNARIARGDKAPVLVSEGDSWFQFPFLIDDVIDHLSARDFNIWSLGAAGDTAENMVFRQPEYMAGLIRHADTVKAFLFSAAGNDIIGADISGTPVLEKLLKQSNGTEKPADLIDQAELGRRLGNLRDAYRKVIDTIRSDARFTALPIVLHGYDYAIPGARDDQRDPIYADPDQWLGQPMRKRNITDETTQRTIIKHLIDALYGMLDDLGQLPGIYVVDVRKTLKTKEDWNDEIHGTDKGFAHVANRFRAVLDTALEESGRSPFARRRMESAGAPGTGQPRSTAPAATIVLDPGHGGSRNEGGSSWNNAEGPKGTLEKDLTLDLGLRAEKLLEARGHRVLMTRKSDRNLGLAGRAAVARNADADVFVSIHFNGWETPTVQGTETYHHSQSNYVSRVLATRVQSAVRAATGLRDRGVKTAGFGVLRPTRHAPETAAALLEVSFITDPAEEERLQDDTYRDRLALALADGIETFLRETQELSPSLEAELAGGERFESFAHEAEEPLEDAAAITEGSERQQAGAAPIPSLQATAGAGPETTAKSAGIANPAQFLRGWRDWRRGLKDLPPTTYLEKTIGTDNTLPVAFLEKGAEVAKAVCKVEAGGIDYMGRPGEWSGTGFLVAPNILLTNHHVLNSAEVARAGRAIFGYQRNASGEWSEQRTFTLDPDRLFITSPAKGGLDYTFVHVEGTPHEAFGTIPMKRAAFTISPAERANIIHHPEGTPKRVSLQDNKVVELGDVMLHYASDTKYGSSGSPVMDNDWRLIALHHAFDLLPKDLVSPDGSDSAYINEGVKMSAIAIDLEARLQSADGNGAARRVLSQFEGVDSLTGYFGALGRRPKEDVPALERVVDSYRGTAQDVDIAFWNVEWFNRRYHQRAGDVARVIADLNLDIWAFEETSREATEALVRELDQQFGFRFDFLASEPDASSAKQTTAVMWNPMTVQCERLEWPEEIDEIIRADSRDPRLARFEAVDGKIFNRYPAIFRFTVEGRTRPQMPFDFNLVPLHLKAKEEGAKRRRLASQVLAWAVNKMIAEHGADNDWLIGGDVNAELATGQFNPLLDAGFASMSAEDEEAGAMSYLKGPKSLIDTIFLSPSLGRTHGVDDFFIYAHDRNAPNYVRDISDHRPIMARLSLSDRVQPGISRVPARDGDRSGSVSEAPSAGAMPSGVSPAGAGPSSTATSGLSTLAAGSPDSHEDILQALVALVRENPATLMQLLLDEIKSLKPDSEE